MVDAALGSATRQALCPQAYQGFLGSALGQYRGWSLVEIYAWGFTLQNKTACLQAVINYKQIE